MGFGKSFLVAEAVSSKDPPMPKSTVSMLPVKSKPHSSVSIPHPPLSPNILQRSDFSSDAILLVTREGNGKQPIAVISLCSPPLHAALSMKQFHCQTMKLKQYRSPFSFLFLISFSYLSLTISIN